MPITNNKPLKPSKPKTISKKILVPSYGKPRITGGISGSGGTNVKKDYKETGNKKNLWEKIQHTFRTKPIESDESLRYHKELESAKRNKNK